MEHIKVTERARDIRMLARNSLKPVWLLCAGGVCLYTILADMSSLITDSAGFSISIEEIQEYVYNFRLYGTIPTISIPAGSWVLLLYSLLVTGPITYGLSLFLMQIFRRKPTRTMEVFLGFSEFGRTFLAHLLMSLITILLSFLFVVPGIIAGLALSMTYFIMVDHPEYTASQAIKASFRLMKGNKWKYFCLQLSFIGWYLLEGLVYTGISQISAYLGVFVSTIISAVLTAYVQLSSVVFYEMAVGNVHRVTNAPSGDSL